MAILKQRLHKKNNSGGYDVVHLETSASLVLMSDGTDVETAVNNKAASNHTHTGYASSSHNQAASTITAGTLAGQMVANTTAVATIGTKQVRNIYAGTTDMTAGSSSLPTGDIYLVYE